MYQQNVQYEDVDVNDFADTYSCTYTDQPDLTDSSNLPPIPKCDTLEPAKWQTR